MQRTLRLLSLLLLTALPGCIVHEPTGRLEPLSTAACSQLGCTPLLLAVYGREGKAQVVGGGSGIAVHDRVILTAGHVVPDEARFLFARVGGTPDSSEEDSPAWRGQGARIRKVIRGGGGPTSKGDWALIVLDRPLTRIGARACSCMCSAGDPAPKIGDAVVIAGFPFAGTTDMINRDPVIVRTTICHAPLDAGSDPAFLYADYASGTTDLSGLSGGPVFTVSRTGEPACLIGIHIATGVSRFGDKVVDRTSVIRRVPTEEIQKAIADLPPPPPPRG